MKNRTKKVVKVKPLTRKQEHLLGEVEMAVGELQNLDERMDDQISELNILLRRAKKDGIKLTHKEVDRNSLNGELSDLENDVDELNNPPTEEDRQRARLR